MQRKALIWTFSGAVSGLVAAYTAAVAYVFWPRDVVYLTFLGSGMEAILLGALFSIPGFLVGGIAGAAAFVAWNWRRL